MQALLTGPDRAPESLSPDGNDEGGHILLIESDPARARRLSHILGAHVRADLEIVRSVDDALRSLAAHVPDLVLTSTFLAPSEESALNAHLRGTPGLAPVQVLTIPHFIDDPALPGSAQKVLSFLSRRATPGAPSCDPTTVVENINAYLAESRARRAAAAAEHALEEPASTALVALAPSTSLRTGASIAHPFGAGHVDDRRRARRRSSGELPWLWSVKLPWGTEVKVVDISNRGVLVESPSKLSAGSTIDLHVVGQGTNVQVPARMVRSEVAAVDALGVRYRVAAAFSRDLEIPGLFPQYPTASLTTRALGDLLSRVMAEVDRCAKPSAVRARFERELRELLPVRDVQIRLTPVVAGPEFESIYYSVPGTSGHGPILQATFHPDYRPSPMEFRLLKAAASLAAVVLEFAPLDGSDAIH